jgi:hypothetical protein
MTLHPRLLEIAGDAIRANIPVRIRILDYANSGLASGTVSCLSVAGYRDGDMFLEVDGFYKNGSVILIWDSLMELVEVVGRYGRLEYLGEGCGPDALARVNFDEFLRYKDLGFAISEMWTPLLLSAGLIKARTQTIYEPVI